MKLEDTEARIAIFELEDKMIQSNQAVINELTKLRLGIIGSAWLIAITLILIAVFK